MPDGQPGSILIFDVEGDHQGDDVLHPFILALCRSIASVLIYTVSRVFDNTTIDTLGGMHAASDLFFMPRQHPPGSPDDGLIVSACGSIASPRERDDVASSISHGQDGSLACAHEDSYRSNPLLALVVRDCLLKLEINKREVSPEEYLEYILQDYGDSRDEVRSR